MAATPGTDADQVLDEVFEQALRAWNESRSYSMEDAIGDRADLRLAAGAAVRLARLVAVQGGGASPSLAGFEILGELGRGSMGSVFLARSLDLGRIVALKVLSPALTFDERERRRLLAEARALAKVEHPHVVRIYEVIEDEIPAYAMEWVDGGSAADLLRAAEEGLPDDWRAQVAHRPGSSAGPGLPEDWRTFACRTGISIGRALGAVHRSGLVHRDVKPSNILIRGDGTALLSDFGVAQDPDLTAFSQSGGMVGTPAYAAPEQIKGDRAAIGPRSDVFGLGATLFHLLTGRPPFYPAAGGLPWQRGAGDELPAPRRIDPTISRDLEAILLRATEPDPARRYPTADAFADDLEALLSLRPVKARPPSLVGRALKAVRRHRRIVSAAAAAFLLATAGTLALWRTAENRQEARRAAVVELRRARTLLLDSRFRGRLWTWLGGNEAFGYIDKTETDIPLGPVVSAYRRAWELDPGNEVIARELRLVEGARNVVSGDAVEGLLTGLPERVAFDYRNGTRSITRDELAAATPSERRAAGFVAFALQDIDACFGAWEILDLETGGGDAFIDAALGRLYIELNDPVHAYPRLIRGADGFPEAGFLALDVADAAVQTRDDRVAERHLAEAFRRGDSDVFRVHDRVEGLILDVQGDVNRALERLERAAVESGSNTTRMMEARLLERRGLPGDLARALRRYAQVALLTSGLPQYSDGMTRLAPAWWRDLATGERLDAVAEAVTGMRRFTARFQLHAPEPLDPATTPVIPPSLFLILTMARAEPVEPRSASLSSTVQRILWEQWTEAGREAARADFRRFVDGLPVTEGLVLSEAGLARALDPPEARECAARAAVLDPVVAEIEPVSLRFVVARSLVAAMLAEVASRARPWLRGTVLRGPALLRWRPELQRGNLAARSLTSMAFAWWTANVLWAALVPVPDPWPEFEVEVFARVPGPSNIVSVPPESILVAEEVLNGQSRIRFLDVAGSSSKELEPSVSFPSAPVLDQAGAVTGVPGSLILWSDTTYPSGELLVISPDRKLSHLWCQPAGKLRSPDFLAIDGMGRLVIAQIDDDNALSSTILAASKGGLATLFQHPSAVSSLGISAGDRIVIADRAGHVRRFDPAGNPAPGWTLPGVGGWPQITHGPGGPVWGSDLYVFTDALGLLLRVDSEGRTVVVASGLGTDLATSMAFGPDGSLYLARLRGGGEIHRIRPRTR